MASATIVRVGFSAAPVVIWLPSDTNKFFTSCACPHLFTTPSLALADIRFVPKLWVDGYGGVGKVLVAPTASYTHNLGTNRMSAKARDGVVNKWGQTHDVKNLFVSDGSQMTTGAAENPTLTIVALAIRQAERIASEMSKGNI